jgi:hypothetical protein
MRTDLTKRRLRRAAAAAVGALLVLAVAASNPALATSYAGWSAPVNLGPAINTIDAEGGAVLSTDGRSMFFHSTRPGGFGGFDYYVSHRTSVNAGWGTPVNLGATVNSASAQQAPGISRDGHWLFITDDRAGGFGGNDLYASWRPDIHDDLGWQTPVNLGPTINTAGSDFGALYVEREGRPPELFFSSSGRPDRLGESDPYVSERHADGSWGPPIHLPELASLLADVRPAIRHDGLEIMFHSTRAGGVGLADLWVSTRATVDAPWSPPVPLPGMNSVNSEFQPSLTEDGRTLFFSSSRPGGAGNTDVYMATRPAVLTVSANGKSRLFGQANPALTATITGFVGGETSAVVSGTAACATTATASSPAGEYPITCTAGSLSAPGYVFETFVAGTLTVAYSMPCSTGPSAGPLRVAAGEAICIGGAHTGPVTVAPGGSLDVEGGQITGPVVANGAAAVRICGATITGPLTITGSTGPVVVGGEGCEPNMAVGPVRVTDNAGGVEVSGNRVIGPLRVTGNAAPVHATGNTVTGPTVIQT